jgi:hypothetical protein
MWKNLGKKDRLKIVFGSQQNDKVMSSFPTVKIFVSSPEVGAACQQPPVHPLVVLCFSVLAPEAMLCSPGDPCFFFNLLCGPQGTKKIIYENSARGF